MDRFDEMAAMWLGRLPATVANVGVLADLLRRVAAESAADRDALAAQVERLREALTRLAVLGNEPLPGNSTGNRIAQAALADTFGDDPAASLAERDAQVRAEERERCAKAAIGRQQTFDDDNASPAKIGRALGIQAAVCAIRALGDEEVPDATGQ